MKRLMIWLYVGVVLFIVSIGVIYGFLYALESGNPGFVWWLLVAVTFAVCASFITALLLWARLDKLRQELDQLCFGHGLTDREHKVLALRVVGFSVSEAADALHCSKSTINREIASLKVKSELYNRLVIDDDTTLREN